ncbi:MAG TPA: PQQ-binding-like beta-propeller repeat protein [Candidatus Dormibacteraeota bacterium]|nr:PQQ-binding-like beta-propeller repeat protein [Candidatus Dormibacteraeota bacterium]
MTSRRPQAHRPGSANSRPRLLVPAAVAVVAIASVALAAAALGGPAAATPSIDPSGTVAASSLAAATSSSSAAAAAAAGCSGTSAGGAAPSSVASSGPLGPAGYGFLIADRGNGRILAIAPDGRILWSFPHAGALPRGQAFSADDAFLAPDHRTIVANDEGHQVIDRIDIATGRIVWQYGHYGVAGSAPGFLYTPDDAYPLANGDVVVADIMNCRILEIAPDHSIVRRWGRAGACHDAPPVAFAEPNGDTPLPDGGLLVTEIQGSRVVRLSPDGHVVFDIHVPVRYPSDAQLDANGNVVVADFSTRGQVVCVDPTGRLVWRYAPASGARRLDHPSLATPLPGGLVAVNDDFRHRVVVIDPSSQTIVWQYGTTDRRGSAPGLLSDPDGHQPLPPGVFG